MFADASFHYGSGEARTLLNHVPRPKIGIFEPVPFSVKWRRPLEKGLAAMIVLVLRVPCALCCVFCRRCDPT